MSNCNRVPQLTLSLVLFALIGAQTLTAISQERTEHGGKAATQDTHADKAAAANGDASGMVKTYRAELDRLRDYVAGSIDPCRNAIFVAARDSQVASIILQKLTSATYVFKGVRCLGGPSVPEQQAVLFDFDCSSGVFCLVDPNVLVIVDVLNGRVIDIIDPYIESSASSGHVHAAAHMRGRRAADRRVDIRTSGLKFVINSVENADIEATLGETVEVTLTTGGNHDWVLVYVENGNEVVWARTGPKSSVTFTADRTGEFEYFCSIGTHRQQGMKGTFIVK